MSHPHVNTFLLLTCFMNWKAVSTMIWSPSKAHQRDNTSSSPTMIYFFIHPWLVSDHTAVMCSSFQTTASVFNILLPAIDLGMNRLAGWWLRHSNDISPYINDQTSALMKTFSMTLHWRWERFWKFMDNSVKTCACGIGLTRRGGGLV